VRNIHKSVGETSKPATVSGCLDISVGLRGHLTGDQLHLGAQP